MRGASMRSQADALRSALCSAPICADPQPDSSAPPKPNLAHRTRTPTHTHRTQLWATALPALSSTLPQMMMDDDDQTSGPGVAANDHASSSSSASQYVTCGDTITADAGCLMGHGTMQSEGKLIATVSGFVERVNKLISVRALHTRYGGEVGDVIVGRIMEVSVRCARTRKQRVRGCGVQTGCAVHCAQQHLNALRPVCLCSFLVRSSPLCSWATSVGRSTWVVVSTRFCCCRP